MAKLIDYTYRGRLPNGQAIVDVKFSAAVVNQLGLTKNTDRWELPFPITTKAEFEEALKPIVRKFLEETRDRKLERDDVVVAGADLEALKNVETALQD